MEPFRARRMGAVSIWAVTGEAVRLFNSFTLSFFSPDRMSRERLAEESGGAEDALDLDGGRIANQKVAGGRLDPLKEFQKEIVKAAEAFTGVIYKNIEAGTKLSEDCAKYGIDADGDETLAKVASTYGDALKIVEKEQEDFNKLLYEQVLEPLRAMINGSPLEEARRLAQRYSKMRQEAEAQTAEARVRESPIPDNVAKLHAAESKMHELRANMVVLGKEAAAALSAVQSQQQGLTFQRLAAMVEGERLFHERVATILGNIEAEIVSEKQRKESAPPLAPPIVPTQKTKYFLAEEFGRILETNEAIRSDLEALCFVPEIRLSADMITLQKLETYNLKITNQSASETVFFHIVYEGMLTIKEDQAEQQYRSRGSQGFPRWIEVTPTTGLIKADQVADICIRHEESQKLEDLVEGVPQSWWSEDTHDKELILAVIVMGSCSSRAKTHQLHVRQCFSGNSFHMDQKGRTFSERSNAAR